LKQFSLGSVWIRPVPVPVLSGSGAERFGHTRCSSGTPLHFGHNGDMPSAAPTEVVENDTDSVVVPDRPWVVIVWNDPINLMTYVTMVIQKVFGYSREKAESLMLDVHQKGKAVVSNGNREKAEMDVFRLHEHGLWATMQQDD
jgi:ATP-dependent Clp protease adaptor protein ClpS